MNTLSFYILAPRSQIEKGVFRQELSKESIRNKVERRTQEYQGKYDDWWADWFYPTLECIHIDIISWESIVACIAQCDPPSGNSLQEFLTFCLQHNGKGCSRDS
jgi:hypothetical protein